MENTSQTVMRCDEAIGRFKLLGHPFYRAWSAGTLPVEALRDYAREYGAFIGMIEAGWRVLGETTVARHESAHAKVWEKTFAQTLGTSVGAPQTPEVLRLVETARECFATPASAAGALFAFEAQQPATAKSKLEGLRAHYRQLPEGCGEYFRLHTGDYDEKALLVDKLSTLDGVSSEQAIGACERLSRALYEALSGIHAPYQAAGVESRC